MLERHALHVPVLSAPPAASALGCEGVGFPTRSLCPFRGSPVNKKGPVVS